MKHWLFISLTLLLWNPFVQAADEYFINNGTITTPPQIDAFNFINNGTFDISTELPDPILSTQPSPPFETSNTRNFTNNGTMLGTPGWRFDNGPASDGQRRWADNVVNRLGGVIQAVDPLALILIGGPNIAAVQPSYFFVTASNIVNQGSFSVGANGTMELTGANINLSRSAIQVTPIVATGSFNDFPNGLFIPDVGITDNWWGQTNMNINSSTLWNGTVARAPRHRVEQRLGGRNISFSVAGPAADSRENVMGGLMLSVTNILGSNTMVFVPTNVFRQAVFVGAPPDMSVDFGFFPSTNPTNGFSTVGLIMSVLLTNLVTTQPEFASIFFQDTLASETNRLMLTNAVATFTQRPANYLLGRLAFGLGAPGDGQPPADYFFNNTFSNRVSAGEYAGYSAFIDNLVSRPPAVPGGTVTNLPGRIRIVSDSLDVSKTRFRGEGEVMVRTAHLVASSNAVMDCENLSFSLGSTNGNLNVVSLAKDAVARLKGDIFAWSGLWTNDSTIITTNYVIDTNVPPAPPLLSPYTNTATYMFHTLIFDASSMQTRLPVTVYDLVMHSTNVVITDNMTVVQSFLIDGQSLTINGNITFSSVSFVDQLGNIVVTSLPNWTFVNAPAIRFFTNNGTLTIPNEANFGDDRPEPYAAFVNSGTIAAGGQRITSTYFENDGVLSGGSAGLIVRTLSGKMENGRLTSVTDIQFVGDILKLERSTISAGNRLDLTVTNSLSDTGGGSANFLSSRDGIRLLIKPQTGDLLGTVVESIAPAFAEVDHLWAGADRGASPSGYLNNIALGQLTLVPEGVDPLFVFSGASANNGLYVDLLDLSQLSDYTNQIRIDPNLVIYFAAAKLGFTPPALDRGVQQEPEEFLAGQFGGRLRWVRDFAGPNSSVEVLRLNGQTVLMNRAVRFSTVTDTDGDGIPNAFDCYPLDPSAWNCPPQTGAGALWKSVAITELGSTKSVSLSWNAAPQTIYTLEYTTNLSAPNWRPLLNYTNAAVTNSVITTLDKTIPVGERQRFYRFRSGL